MKSFEEYWFPEFYNKGKAAGKAEGAEALRSALNNLLLSRFEKVDPQLLADLDKINDIHTLSSLIVPVTKVTSLDDVRMLIYRYLSKAQ